MDKPATYKLEKRSVNNKALFLEVHQFAQEGIQDGGVMWANDVHRSSFVEILDDWMSEFADKELIDQWNIICDFRNNTIASMDKGIYVLEVAYRQKNCLNTTRLIYTITDPFISNLKELLDFTLSP